MSNQKYEKEVNVKLRHVDKSNSKGKSKKSYQKIESRPRKVKLSKKLLSNHALRLMSNYILEDLKRIGILKKIAGKKHNNPWRD